MMRFKRFSTSEWFKQLRLKYRIKLLEVYLNETSTFVHGSMILVPRLVYPACLFSVHLPMQCRYILRTVEGLVFVGTKRGVLPSTIIPALVMTNPLLLAVHCLVLQDVTF